MLSLEPNVVSRHTFVVYSYTVKWIQSIQVQALRRSMSIRGSPERLKTGNTPPLPPPPFFDSINNLPQLGPPYLLKQRELQLGQPSFRNMVHFSKKTFCLHLWFLPGGTCWKPRYYKWSCIPVDHKRVRTPLLGLEKGPMRRRGVGHGHAVEKKMGR